jgi:hypothetical protein
MTIRMRHTIMGFAATAALMLLAGASAAHAAPVKEVRSATFGLNVNKTKLAEAGSTQQERNVCTVESKDECQPAIEGSAAGAFAYASGAGGASNGNVYVADTGNSRVQEFKSTGEFVLMFGSKVNKKGGDVCIAAETSECQAGVRGVAAGQLFRSESVAVDPVSGAVYIAELVIGGGNTTVGERVQEFTAEGRFVLEIGKEVNEKTKGNLCTEKEVEEKTGVKCIGPALHADGVKETSEHGAFDFEEGGRNVLAAGGEGDLLYVGEEHRVQEFDAQGVWKGEIPVSGSVTAIAVGAGGISFVENDENVIHDLNSKGQPVNEFKVAPREERAEVKIGSLARDSEGRLAVPADEARQIVGGLYQASAGQLVTEFEMPAEGIGGLGFNGGDELYGVEAHWGREVVAYKPVHVAELLTRAQTCVPGADHETDATLNCSLNGEVDPWGVKETEVWFKWGHSCESLGSVTPKQPIPNEKPNEGEEEVPVKVSAAVEAVKPDAAVCYRLVGEDRNVKAPESALMSVEATLFTTPAVPARIVGVPSASFIKASSAVLFGELNPENAPTEYFFEYATTLGGYCEGALRTKTVQSTAYGKIGATLEATGLQPATTYRYRLCATDEAGRALDEHGGGKIEEGVFTSAAAPVPHATTAPASAITPTSAIVSGEVNPDGLPATYTFELGVYNSAGTQYGVVFSGPAGASTIPVAESLALTGLQPGTTYAYRIVVKSGYGTATGETVTFTTAGLPSALVLPSVLAQLAVPNIAFPTESQAPKSSTKCKRGYKRDKRGRCLKSKKKAKSRGRGKGTHGKRR